MGLILLMGFVSAHGIIYKRMAAPTQYLPQNIIIAHETTWNNYYDVRRFSLFDYRHGYSYRATPDYFNQEIKKNIIVANNNFYAYQNIERRSYQYVPYLQTYKRQSCYIAPPSNRLFYISC